MKKLHLGCGTKKIKNFINIDIRKDVNPDLIDDIGKLESFEINSVDLIYACHVLEHFGRHEYKKILKRWYDILKPNSVLRLSVPDFSKVVEMYYKGYGLNNLIGFLYGGQNYEQNYHYYVWDFNTLSEDLLSAGFKEVIRYDWKTVDHSDVDDFSQAYIPHMDKENGTLMSLNIEAKK